MAWLTRRALELLSRAVRAFGDVEVREPLKVKLRGIVRPQPVITPDKLTVSCPFERDPVPPFMTKETAAQVPAAAGGQFSPTITKLFPSVTDAEGPDPSPHTSWTMSAFVPERKMWVSAPDELVL